MKPLFLKKNLQSSTSSFLALKTDVPFIYDKWHYHEELELLYVIRGTGSRFIGNSVKEFSHGDMVLVGSNLPHVWKNDKIYYEDEKTTASAVLLQFAPNLLDQSFLNLPEMTKIKKVLDDSQMGLKVNKKMVEIIAPLLDKLIIAKGPNRIIILLQVLNKIASSEYELLSSQWFNKSYQGSKDKRINKVYDYIMNNFQKKISLKDLAEVANMNESALCRYFKSSTKKTITEFINEVRIGYAFNLMNTKDYSISMACYESGFNNLSYFYRQFNKVMGYSPSHFSKKIKKRPHNKR
ncbi:AraC family transcriptional regulator [Ulvibacterium sp.]|uniref:AraC family transcriptional regulator n=1 Tax=Ulvibacterium sp. TaxID=2665914 RepID=UPI003BAB7EB8